MLINLIRQNSIRFFIMFFLFLFVFSPAFAQEPEMPEEGPGMPGEGTESSEGVPEGLMTELPRLVVNNADVKAFLNLLAKPSGMSFLTTASVKGQITVQLNNIKVIEVLDTVLRIMRSCI